MPNYPRQSQAGNKAAAQRKTAPKPATPKRTVSRGGGGALGAGIGGGLKTNLAGPKTGSGNPAVAAPNYEAPTAMGAVTPIAAPPVITDPFLTPTDLANQALDLASVDQYLSGVDLQTNQARSDAASKQQQIDTSEGRNLEATDWNTAARGLAQSSVRDTTKANLSADANAARGTTQTNLSNAENYAAGEHQRTNTVVKPSINSKYAEAAKRNAQDVTDNSPPPVDESGGTAPADPGPAPAAPAAAGSDVPQVTGSSAQWNPVVKDGKFYHYYPDTHKYVYIRDAA